MAEAGAVPFPLIASDEGVIDRATWVRASLPPLGIALVLTSSRSGSRPTSRAISRSEALFDRLA